MESPASAPFVREKTRCRRRRRRHRSRFHAVLEGAAFAAPPNHLVSKRRSWPGTVTFALSHWKHTGERSSHSTVVVDLRDARGPSGGVACFDAVVVYTSGTRYSVRQASRSCSVLFHEPGREQVCIERVGPRPQKEQCSIFIVVRPSKRSPRFDCRTLRPWKREMVLVEHGDTRS